MILRMLDFAEAEKIINGRSPKMHISNILYQSVFLSWGFLFCLILVAAAVLF